MHYISCFVFVVVVVIDMAFIILVVFVLGGGLGIVIGLEFLFPLSFFLLLFSQVVEFIDSLCGGQASELKVKDMDK